MRPYRPSNKAPLLGIMVLVIYTLVGAITLGAIVFGVSQIIYLIALFPLIIGAIGGAIVAAAVKRGKVRNSAVAILFAVLSGECDLYRSIGRAQVVL